MSSAESWSIGAGLDRRQQRHGLIIERNHFLVDADLVDMTLTISGAMNNAQRRSVGSVIQRTGHKTWELARPVAETFANAASVCSTRLMEIIAGPPPRAEFPHMDMTRAGGRVPSGSDSP